MIEGHLADGQKLYWGIVEYLGDPLPNAEVSRLSNGAPVCAHFVGFARVPELVERAAKHLAIHALAHGRSQIDVRLYCGEEKYEPERLKCCPDCSHVPSD
jgi:hypothetical protein